MYTSKCLDYGSLCYIGVLRGSMVKCLDRNLGVLGSNCTGSSWSFVGVSFGQKTSEPQLSTGETQERHE